MKAIILECRDGSRHLTCVVPLAFDTQQWANERRNAFRLLDVVRVIETIRS